MREIKKKKQSEQVCFQETEEYETIRIVEIIDAGPQNNGAKSDSRGEIESNGSIS